MVFIRAAPLRLAITLFTRVGNVLVATMHVFVYLRERYNGCVHCILVLKGSGVQDELSLFFVVWFLGMEVHMSMTSFFVSGHGTCLCLPAELLFRDENAVQLPVRAPRFVC